MINLVRDFFSREQSSSGASENLADADLWRRLAANGAHEWITHDPALSRAFKLILAALPHSARQKLFTASELVFIPSQAQLACALTARPNHHVILLFPDLIKLFYSAKYTSAIAVILHELGHLYFDHGNRLLDVLEAQVEADSFATLCGYGHELQEVLLDSPQTIDTKVRISRLTLDLMTSSEH